MRGNPKSQDLIPRRVAQFGIAARQPPLWLFVSALMAVLGGKKGRRAAARGSVCYLVGAVVGNLPKPLFGRPQPRHRWARKPQVARGAFPSGHAAAEVAFVFGAAQEAPGVFVPLGAVAMAAHLSLVKAGKHFVSDQLVGGTVGIGVAALSAKIWPPDNPAVRRTYEKTKESLATGSTS